MTVSLDAALAEVTRGRGSAPKHSSSALSGTFVNFTSCSCLCDKDKEKKKKIQAESRWFVRHSANHLCTDGVTRA